MQRDVQGYAATFADVQQCLADSIAPHRWAHGRRIDKETVDDGRGREIVLKHKEEYVLFCGWESVEKHVEFAGTPCSSEFDTISAYMS